MDAEEVSSESSRTDKSDTTNMDDVMAEWLIARLQTLVVRVLANLKYYLWLKVRIVIITSNVVYFPSRRNWVDSNILETSPVPRSYTT